MSRNTFSFPLPGINDLCQGKTAEPDEESEIEGEKKDDDVIG